MDAQDTRGFDAELAEYQSQFPDDPTGYFRHTLNSLSDDLQAIQAGDYWRFDYQSYTAHLHEAGGDAVGFFTELYRYLRSRLIRSFEKGVFCLDAMNTAAPERQRARGFFRRLLDELRHTPPEPFTSDDAEAIHFEIKLMLFDNVRTRITTGAIEAVAAVADEIESSAGGGLLAEPTKEPLPETNNRPTCTLKKFIETGCNIIHGDAIESKVQLIYKAAAAGRIELPKEAARWENGRAKIFYEDDLRVLWSSYTKEIPSLFRLK